MKMIFHKLLTFSCIALLIVSSCKKDETKVTLMAQPVPATLTSTASALVLSKADADKSAVTFNFTTPDFGFTSAVTNTLQIGVKGTNFVGAKEASFDAGVLTKMYTVSDFNALLNAMKLPTGASSNIEVRLKSQITSSMVEPVYSPVLTLSVNPYTLIIPASFLYVPGAYQGWTPATADSLISVTSNGIYKGVINYTPGNLGFKILTKKSWGPPEYGKGSAEGTIAIGGGDLSAPAADSYELIADINANTLIFNKLTWGIIGSATPGGWDNDTNMGYNNGKRIWNITLNLVAGEIKFRKNDAWDTNYGGSNGALALGGSNIAITEAGSYKIEMNLVTNTYTVTKL